LPSLEPLKFIYEKTSLIHNDSSDPHILRFLRPKEGNGDDDQGRHHTRRVDRQEDDDDHGKEIGRNDRNVDHRQEENPGRNLFHLIVVQHDEEEQREHRGFTFAFGQEER
jgi:hypothetical protein